MATYDGKKALIVDDFPTARRLIKETLQEIGFECVEAADVDQALKLFDEEKVDLVIADTFMPEKNGMDLLKTLREDPENEDLTTAAQTDPALANFSGFASVVVVVNKSQWFGTGTVGA